MGSVQALRSEALAGRAREDTNVQISGYLGTVNKSLGSQISNLIDSLQGVIAERTKAYNSIMSSKVKKSIEGKGGVGEIAVKQAFELVRTAIAAVEAIAAQDPIEIAAATLKVVQGWAVLQGAKANFKAACYDYERAASELGLNSVEPSEVRTGTDDNGNGGTPIGKRNGGAVQLVNLRDAIMPRYKPRDASFPLQERGYVGTLRRI